jgi:hypothetical protein
MVGCRADFRVPMMQFCSTAPSRDLIEQQQSDTRDQSRERHPPRPDEYARQGLPSRDLTRMSARLTIAKIASVKQAVRSASPASDTASASIRIAPTPIAVARSGVRVVGFSRVRAYGRFP